MNPVLSDNGASTAEPAGAAQFRIGNRPIGESEPTYFIADLGANHDGQLERAKLLIRLAKEAGADAAKFQHFRAPTIISDRGFQDLGQLSHTAKWKKSVYDVFDECALPYEWTPELKACCDEAGIDFLSTPYDMDAVDLLDPLVPAYKIGSGDITWPALLGKVASKGKPVILATGASDLADVGRAVRLFEDEKSSVALLQCNSNYTGKIDNFKHIHLNVLRSFRAMFPEVVLGLSDHTPGHATVLGAVALGGRVIEKHFTDDTSRPGPDHHFAMDPRTWRDMVDRTRELELALGETEKYVARNEQDTVVVQRRCLRATRDLEPGAVLTSEDIEALRPAPRGAIFPYDLDKLIGRRVLNPVYRGQYFSWDMLND
ncbi:MAG: N-acetylneuraminate synthase family protein [Bryobacteraceae bacterium]